MNGGGEPPRRPTVVIAGGGVSGLAVAFELAERSQRLPDGIELICFERGDVPGGNVRTTRRDGFLCEWGPHGFLDDAPHTQTLVRRLGLHDRLMLPRQPAFDRYLYRNGRLRRVPRKPLELVRSGLLSPLGLLRLFGEPLVRKQSEDGDPSVQEFAERRMGREAARTLIDALVTGVYAGDPARLSMRSAFPRVWNAAIEHKSLFRAMLAQRQRAAEPEQRVAPIGMRGRVNSFRDGMQELTAALAAALGDRLRTGTRVAGVSDMGRRGFRVLLDQGPPLDVDAVVLATPARVSAELLQGTDAELIDTLSSLETAPMAVVHLGFREAETAGRPRGSGFLAPRGQGVRILGTHWASDVLDARAPSGFLLWTTMVGGARDPAGAELDDRELLALVRGDLARATGVDAEPVFSEVIRHPHAIPQYDVGHRDRVATLEGALARHPGLFLCGWSYRGISVNACVKEAPQVAEAVLTRLTR